MTQVIVVGGGLAGMVAALRLAERGCEVTLFDSANRLGGKAGANQNGENFDEHGYHIFPDWYRNTWKLVDELGIRGNFEDRAGFLNLRLENANPPHYTALLNINSVPYIWQNLTSGTLPFLQMVLFFYAALDLVCQPYSYRAYLDQITVNGFVRSRFYRTEQVARQFQDMMLKGISCPAYEVSAMTMRNVMRYWTRYPLPTYRILKGNLQQLCIEPIQARLVELGCTIRRGQALEKLHVEGARIARLDMRDLTTSGTYQVDVDQLILAIPVEKAAALVSDEVYLAAPSLGRLQYLRSRSMAALNLYFGRQIPGFPKDHINLLDSRYGLSFLDVSQTWGGCKGTVLNLIASDFVSLAHLDDATAIQEMFADLQSFYPTLRWDDVASTNFQSHLDAPLFMNDAGAWHFRPDSLDPDDPLRKELTNLHLAGDYCRSHVDLVCMEGAVTTGLRAAEAVRQAAGIADPIPILIAEDPPIGQFRLIKWALLPLIAITKLLVVIQDLLSNSKA
ncbi:MAG TPA: FAD-dependent oxidoreductase [Aggregatilineales bacterium]|nr:FAD-dependent oxidoreductase [Aggregatilineales bacterium]